MKRITIGWVGAVALTAAACGGSKASSASGGLQALATPAPLPQTATLTVQPAPPAPQPVALNSPLVAPPVTTPVNFESLIALLPDAPSGWTRGKPKGNEVGMGIASSRAEADYEKGDSAIHLEITDTTFNQTYLAPLRFTLATGYSERSHNVYTKAAPVGGSPGYERWDSEAKSSEVTMVVANRIVVSARGRNVDNVDATRGLVGAIDQGRLRILK